MRSHIFLFGSLPRRRRPEFTAILAALSDLNVRILEGSDGNLCSSLALPVGRRRPENVSILSSLIYARTTGKAESAVKEAEKMLKKSELRNGLVQHTNTPSQGMTNSLAQRFLCRQMSILPVSESLLRQSVPPVEVVCEELLDRRA